MAALPDPPAEARLIARRRAAMIPELSMRQAAKRAGISAALWAKIEHGYDQVAKGIAVPYTGTADKVARMARVVGATADELTAASRPDAAAGLSAMAPPPQLRPSGERQLIAEIRQRLDFLEREFEKAREQGRGRGADDDAEDERGGRHVASG